jgi:hypothetical protein
MALSDRRTARTFSSLPSRSNEARKTKKISPSGSRTPRCPVTGDDVTDTPRKTTRPFTVVAVRADLLINGCATRNPDQI